MSEGWKGDLTHQLDRIAGIATGAGSLHILVAGSRLALALPEDRRAANVVIDLYQPQRWKGRAFRMLAKAAVAGRLTGWLPSHSGATTTPPLATWLREAAARGTVGFLGCNPNHGLRCVLAGIDPASGGKFVAKLGLDESAVAVRREAAILANLSDRAPGVVHSLGTITSDDTLAPVDGDRPYSEMNWALLRLPHLGNVSPKKMADLKVRSLLQQWMSEDYRRLGHEEGSAALLNHISADEAPAGWHERIKSRRIRLALQHGDFAVWNLRDTPDGLVAIDWEWGRENAAAGIDLAHGLRQECYMVHGLKPVQAVAWILEQAASPMWREYLENCGWGGAHEDWLRLGLLHSHFNALNPSADLLEVLGIHLKR